MDLEDFWKKAFESEMEADEKASADKLPEEMKSLISTLSGYKMVQIGKAAVDKKSELIQDLTEYLSKLDPKDKPSWHANASVMIQRAAKKMTILDTIVSIMTLGCMAEDKQYDDVIDTVMKVNAL